MLKSILIANRGEIARRIIDFVVESFILKNARSLTRSATAEQILGPQKSVLVANSESAQFRVQPRRRERPETSEYFLELAAYRVVPNATAPRFLIPIASRGSILRSLQIYNAQRLLARLGKRLLSTAVGVELAKVFLRDVASVSIRRDISRARWGSLILQEHLKDLFGLDSLTLSVSLGTPGVHQKPLLQVMDQKGKILGYVKVGWNGETIELVQREKSALSSLEHRRFSTAAVPRVIHAGWWRERYLLIQEAPQSRSDDSLQNITDQHLQFLLELHSTNPSCSQLQESKFVRGLQRRLAFLRSSGFTYYGHLLQLAFSGCNDRLGNAEIPFGFRHGDFTPWNILFTCDKLFVVDWEYAQQLSLPGWDLFHFIIQTAVLVRGRSAGQIYENFTQQGQNHEYVHAYLQELGISPDLAGPLLSLYLVDVLSWYLCRDGRRVSAKGEALRRTWRGLLTLLLLGGKPLAWGEH